MALVEDKYDNFKEDPIDRGKIGEYFSSIFDVFSHTANGKYVFIMNIPNNYAYWSSEAVSYFGLPSNRMYNPIEVWGEKINPHDREMFYEDIKSLLEKRIDEHNLTYRIKNKNGDYVTCTCRGCIIYDDNGEMLYFAGNVINHQKSELIDPVTGLRNRDGLFACMNDLKKENKKYYFLMAGLKQFYKVNYAYGYDFGNQILGIIADMWREMNDNGVVFRTEGTKAVLIFEMDKYSKRDVEKKYKEISDKLKQGIEYNGCKVFLSIYACLYESTNLDLDVNTIYNCAMYATNKKKKEENDEIFLVTENLFSGNKIFMEKLSYIRNCIHKNFMGFYLVYQPIVSADTGELTGAEALIRWKGEPYGFVPPNEFIEWLEGDTIFYDLGNWIIRQAIRDTKELIEIYPDILVNINLAYPQLQNLRFNSDLSDILEEEGFNPQNLNLELTERCKFSNIDTLRSSIAFFKSLGISSALDDFGTGYSALDLMVELQVDEIKIDKSFIQDIDKDISRQSLLKAITTCAHELGKRVCVEGIETEVMAGYLYNHFEITKYQGYYFSKPLEKQDFIDWVKKNKEDFAK
ncbi:MAG: sensor domain-containing phosphodiesterase [Catonella sp.]|uniref:sensor domain-containing phosphodiesterase n=1 Tax=Catonella sp. TaxID=2382125 RepID=UPI003F9EEB53